MCSWVLGQENGEFQLYLHTTLGSLILKMPNFLGHFLIPWLPESLSSCSGSRVWTMSLFLLVSKIHPGTHRDIAPRVLGPSPEHSGSTEGTLLLQLWPHPSATLLLWLLLATLCLTSCSLPILSLCLEYFSSLLTPSLPLASCV